MIVLGALAAAALVSLIIGWLLRLSIFSRPLNPEIDEVDATVRRLDRHASRRSFSTTTVTLSLAAFFVVALLFVVVTQSVIVAIALGVLSALVPLFVERRRLAREKVERNEAWPDAIRQIASNLRAPMSVHASLVDLAETGPNQLKPAFETYTVLSRRLDSAQALDMVRRDLADPVSDRVIEILILSLEQGSAVTIDVLTELASSVTEDLRLNETIRTMMLDVRIDAAAIAILPFGLLLATLWRIPEWREFYGTLFGQLLLLACMIWTTTGVMTILMIIRVKPEPRVLMVDGEAPT